MLPSRIDKVRFRGRSFYVKRDDLIDTCLSGNKYRKLYTLLQTPSKTYTKLISYGGAQSNAMYALSCLCKTKGWEFHYYTKTLPQFLKDGIEGNLDLSINNGMVLHEIEHVDFQDKISELHSLYEDKTLLVSQGGADEIAKNGIVVLGQEIQEWKEENNIKDLVVVLPSGTGTTALFLNEFLDIEVFTCSCVGDDEYLKKQFFQLQTNESLHPIILKKEKKFHFGKLYKSNFEIWKDLKKQTNITFDLLYDPIAWQTLFFNKNNIDINNILYIHQGGLIGNETMIERYNRKYKNT